ncbi:hypothetical protein CN918_32455 [Priestia megaterium]|nr:hypothetical protein CN918_32455 [Priestia megaterium]
MVFFYLSALLGITFNFSRNKKGNNLFITYQVAKIVLLIAYIFYLTYLSMLDVTFGAWFTHIAWIIAIIWIAEYYSFYRKQNTFGLLLYTLGLLVLFISLYLASIYPMTIASDKYDAVSGIEKKTELPQTDEQNIVSVPLVYAKYKAEKLIGELKNYSYYDLGVYTIQKIDGKLKYVTPIEFSEFSTWRRSGKKVPGYIIVDALDENAEAKLVKKTMKYVPSSYFGDNLIRKVRKKYPQDILLGASFEPDDKGNPYYTVPYGHYDKFRRITKVDGIILFNPNTGNMKKYTMKNIPSFIDQVIPSSLASTYNTWYGKYVMGWLNSWWGKKEVKLPTKGGFDGNVAPVFDNKRHMNLFTDFTTLNQNASSMVGYSMVNARTGKYIFYTGQNINGLINGGSAKNAVNKTYTKDKWVGTQPMLYNVYGEMTWFLPVVDKDGLLRSYALVNAKDPKVLATSDTKQKTFETYKRLLVTKLNGKNVKPGSGLEMKKITGTVISKEVVAKDDVITYIQVDTDKKKVYQLSLSKDPYSVVLEKGTNITVTYVDSDEPLVEIQKLKINELHNKKLAE